MAKKNKQQEGRRCGECALGEVYTAFHTLSIHGKPTMKTCPYSEYKRLLSEKACVEHFK